MATKHTIQASVNVVDGFLAATVGPVTVDVPNVASENDDQVLEWKITEGDAIFDTDQPIILNNATAATPAFPPITRSADGKTVTSAVFQNTAQGTSPVKWFYTVNMWLGTQHVRIDPEVDNLPPNP